MTRTIAVAALLFAMLATTAEAQQSDSLRPAVAPFDTIWGDITASAGDLLHVLGAPTRWETRDWGLAGGSVAAIGLATLVDEEVRDTYGTDDHRFVEPIREAAYTSGLWFTPVALGGGLYLTGLAIDDRDVRLMGRHVVQAATYTALVTTSVKVLLGRHRPALGDGPYAFEGPSTDDAFNSFPSGHAALAFSMASSLAADIDRWWASGLLYGAAAIVAASRVDADRHWTSDVLGGAIIGTAIGWGTATIGDEEITHSNWRLVPTGNGLAVVGRW